MTNSKSAKEGRNWRRVAICAALVVITLWLFLGWYASLDEQPGIFGDKFGAATSLFSGLAFVGIIVTILIQSEELELQRNELQLTREELRGQRENYAEQNRILQRQDQIGIFFQMLRFFTDTSRSMTHPGWVVTAGVEYWRNMTKLLGRTPGFQDAQSNPTTIGNIYEKFFRENEPSLGHYFASFTEILLYLESLALHDRGAFARLFRAQLSSNELIMIYYHGFGKTGSGEIKTLVEKYGILKFLPETAGGNVRHYYAASAYFDPA